MPSSNPPPDRFQREIDDIIRLAERRLERQSLGNRMRRQSRKLGGAVGGLDLHMPPAETLGGLGLAFLMLAWFFSLRLLPPMLIIDLIEPWIAGIGILLLVMAILTSVMRGRSGGGGGGGGGTKNWRGEQVSYGNPYGESFLQRLKRMFGGR